MVINEELRKQTVKEIKNTWVMRIPAHPDGESEGIRTLNRDIRTPCRRI